MKAPTEMPPSRLAVVLLGIARVARGRKDGLAQFGDSAQAVLAALAPLVAFLLVGTVLSLLSGNRDAVEYVAVVTVLLLAPLAISFEIARRWHRAHEWFRFATAFCWCQWAAPMALMVVLLLMALLMASGLGENATAGVGLACLFCYGQWLHWFLARNALDVTPLRAAILVVTVNLLTMVVILVPQFADYALNGPPPP